MRSDLLIRLDALCAQLEQISQESRASRAFDVELIDNRVDRLIDAVGTLAYLMSKQVAREEAV